MLIGIGSPRRDGVATHAFDPTRWAMRGADQPVIDFSAYVAERTQGFDGRDWILLAIDAWLADPAGPPLFLLTGEPGAGKSAMAGRLALISTGAVRAPEGPPRSGPDSSALSTSARLATAAGSTPRSSPSRWPGNSPTATPPTRWRC